MAHGRVARGSSITETWWSVRGGGSIKERQSSSFASQVAVEQGWTERSRPRGSAFPPLEEACNRSTVKAEKTEIIRHDDKVEMNGDKMTAEEEEKAR